MKALALALAVISCVAVPAPALAQEVVFADAFEVDSGLWCTDYDYSPSDRRAVDPLEPTNLVLRPPGSYGGFFSYPYMSIWSAPIPVDMASTYVLSFRFLDESPEIQTGSVTLRDDPDVPEGYAMPFQLIADGSWHDYSVEFTPGELLGPDTGVFLICLTGFKLCSFGEWSWGMCERETFVYFDDFQIERSASIPNEPTSWGRVKDLFR